MPSFFPSPLAAHARAPFRSRGLALSFGVLLGALLPATLCAATPQESAATTDAASKPAAGLPDAPVMPVSDATRAMAAKLVGDLMVDGQAYEYDRQLADTIGPRLTGSPNYMRAAEWAQAKFKAMGLANVHTENWTIPATWEPEPEHPATGHIVSPVDHVLHIYSKGWSPSTAKHGVSGPVVYLTAITPGVMDAMASKLRGALVLVDRESFGKKPTLEAELGALARVEKSGAAGLLTVGGTNGTEVGGATSFDGRIAPIPEAQIGTEDASLLRRLLEAGPVTVEFTLENRIRKDVAVPNVIAELPGSDPSLPVVMIGAHLDSWNAGTGAQDNGTGVATVLEAARAMHALGTPPLRTVRFALFGGEEQGLLGSLAYTRAHQAELAAIDAILISDTGAQPAKGWYLMGRDDEASALKNVEPLLAGLGANKTSDDTEFIFETDHAALDVLGVPSLVLWNDVDLYFRLHHKASDTFDSVSQKDLNQGAAVTAVTALAIADSREPFAPHLTPGAFRPTLVKHEQDKDYDYLKKINALP